MPPGCSVAVNWCRRNDGTEATANRSVGDTHRDLRQNRVRFGDLRHRRGHHALFLTLVFAERGAGQDQEGSVAGVLGGGGTPVAPLAFADEGSSRPSCKATCSSAASKRARESAATRRK